MLDARTRLPNRRAGHSVTIDVNGHAITARVNRDPATGRPMEIFLTGAKDGTDLGYLLDDASVLISIALQHGITAAEMSKSMGRPATSAIGMALSLIDEQGRDPDTGEAS